MSIDATDRRILDELQRDGAQSAADVATKLSLSNTPCWRRIQQLRGARLLHADWRVGFPAAYRHARHEGIRVVLSRSPVEGPQRPVGELVDRGHGDQGIHRAAAREGLTGTTGDILRPPGFRMRPVRP